MVKLQVKETYWTDRGRDRSEPYIIFQVRYLTKNQSDKNPKFYSFLLLTLTVKAWPWYAKDLSNKNQNSYFMNQLQLDALDDVL